MQIFVKTVGKRHSPAIKCVWCSACHSFRGSAVAVPGNERKPNHRAWGGCLGPAGMHFGSLDLDWIAFQQSHLGFGLHFQVSLVFNLKLGLDLDCFQFARLDLDWSLDWIALAIQGSGLDGTASHLPESRPSHSPPLCSKNSPLPALHHSPSEHSLPQTLRPSHPSLPR